MRAKLTIKSKIYHLFVILLALSTQESGFSQTTFTPHTPYPIIFIHGVNSNYKTWWYHDVYGILDFLKAGDTPLLDGGNINISLDYQRNADHLNTTKEQDVHLFSINPFFGDFYTVNFDVHATSGEFTREPPDYATVLAELNTAVFFDWETQISVTRPDQFSIFDIIRIGDEFMEVIAIDGGTLVVNRGVLNSEISIHFVNDYIYNLSTQGNQASIAKQGFGLKKAIDIIKEKTNAEKVILVGHSMGGLAAREYIQSDYYQNDVAKIVTIGTPHYGSDITDFPNFLLGFGGVDGKSEAVRDLRTTIQRIPTMILGIYLYGGPENLITGYYDKDVNSNGLENDHISGLDENPAQYYQNISTSWIVSSFLGSNNDMAVLTQSQYTYFGDTLMTDRPHVPISILGIHYDGETTDIYSLIRGLDEPDTPELAYKIGGNSTTKGFITFQTNNNPVDIDLYKIVLDNDCILTINISGNNYSSINQFELLDENQNVIKGNIGISEPLVQNVTADTYFIRIRGTATSGTNPSYQYPYTLTTHTEAVIPSVLITSPSDLLEFYDVIINQSSNKTIGLTNNGTTDITVSSLTLSGSNGDQFSIVGPTAFVIPPGSTTEVHITFNPTSRGEKNATFVIANDTPDSPIKNITLKGTGVENGTKFIVVNPDISYNFWNTTLNNGKTKTFSIQNTGTDILSVSGLSLTGINSLEFSITNPSGLPFDIEPGGSKHFDVTFLPITAGQKQAELIISNNSDNASPSKSVTLNGNATDGGNTGGWGNITAYEYWFDDNYASKVYTTGPLLYGTDLTTAFPTTGLNTGLHNLHIRFKDNKGQWSSIVSEVFHKLPFSAYGERKIIAYEYWFDNDYAAKVFQSVSPQQTYILNEALNATALPLGLHNFHIRYKDDGGQWSSVVSEVIFKIGIPASSNNLISGYRYWFDMADQEMINVTLPSPVNPYQLVQNIYVGNLSIGDHSIHFQFKDIAGQWSSVITAQFTFTGPPEQRTITTQTITNGETNCFDALQTVTVAGNGATFIIQTGGIANIIAGQKILFLPNTMVQSGGYLYGHISPDGPFCVTPSMPAVLKGESEKEEIQPIVSETSSFKIYPNPTTGKFTLELGEAISGNNIKVEVYGMRGEKILSKYLNQEKKYEFSLSGKPTGVYFIRVITGNKAETVKIIKQ